MYIISACLCGVNCKYNGKNNVSDKCLKLLKEGKAVLVCPEQLAGLPTPRNPVEIIGKSKDIIFDEKGSVVDKEGNDYTNQFLMGALETLGIAKRSNAVAAILKEGSPSCGSNFVYDGTFSGNKVEGKGITAEFLEQNGILVFSDEDILDEEGKVISFEHFNRKRVEKRREFKKLESLFDDDFEEEEYFDLTNQDINDENLPPNVEKSVKTLMVSLAKDMMGFDEIDEISEATGMDIEEVKKILESLKKEDGEE